MSLSLLGDRPAHQIIETYRHVDNDGVTALSDVTP